MCVCVGSLIEPHLIWGIVRVALHNGKACACFVLLMGIKRHEGSLTSQYLFERYKQFGMGRFLPFQFELMREDVFYMADIALSLSTCTEDGF